MSLDFPCNTSEDCFNYEPLVPRVCIQTDLGKFYECSIVFGWKGEFCDQPSIFLRYSTTVSFFFLIWVVLLLVAALRVVVCNAILEGLSIQAVAITAYSNFSSILAAFIYLIIKFPAYFDPSYLEILTFQRIVGSEEFQDVDAKGAFYSYAAFLISVQFSMLSCLFLTLSWQDIITRVSMFESYHAGRIAKQLATLLKISFAINFVLLLFCLIFQLFRAIVIQVSLVSIYVVFTFCRISKRFNMSLSSLLSSSQEQSLLQLTATYVKRIRSLVIVSWFVIAIGGILYVVTLNLFSESVSLGDFDVTALIRDVVFAAYLFQFTAVAWYVNSVSVGPIVAETYLPCLCGLFKYWDKMNTRLIPEEILSEELILSNAPTNKQTLHGNGKTTLLEFL